MSFTWLVLIRWLHIFSGIVWCGGQILMAAAIWPALMRRPASEAKSAAEAIGPLVGLCLGAAEFSVLGLGVVLGTWLGPLDSIASLYDTAYGRTFSTAFLSACLLILYGWITRRQLSKRVWNGDRFQPGAVTYLRWTNVISLMGLGVITVCMAFLHFGL